MSYDGAEKAAVHWGPKLRLEEGVAGGTLTDRAAQLIYGDLTAGRFAPGDRLKPEELKGRYGLGSSPIRDALMQLSSMGLVALEGHRGFRAAPASEAELVDIADIRSELCCMALQRSIERGDDRWEAAIVAAFHRMERIKQATIRDPETHFAEWEARNKEFHNALEAACGSPWLLYFSSVAFSQSERYRRHFASSYDTIIPEAQEEHRLIMEASLARDAARATEGLRSHIIRNMEKVRPLVREKLADTDSNAR